MKATAGRRLTYGIGLAASLFSAPLMAAHFTFKVPYEFHGMGPDVNALRINCVVFDDNNNSLGSGYKSASINKSTGEASGTLTIAFDVDEGKSAFDATNYRCRLTQMWVSGANPIWQDPDSNHSNWQFRPDPGAAFVRDVTGTLPGVMRKSAPQLRIPQQLRWQR